MYCCAVEKLSAPPRGDEKGTLSSLLKQASLGDLEPKWKNKLDMVLQKHPLIIQWTEELDQSAVVKHHIYTTSDQLLYQP